MRMIYKYELQLGTQVVRMPAGAQVLSAHNQHGSLCIWALVDPKAPMVDRAFLVTGTGHTIEEGIRLDLFIGTVIISPFVWHVFEV